MNDRKPVACIFLVVFFFLCAAPAVALEAGFKVLAVMSYEVDFPWCEDLKRGIEPVLQDSCEIRYFYMDTKKRLEDGDAKAAEAFELFKSYKPDGVIAADDNAQSMFVVPYLKEKTEIPVMFCGVNAEPEKYGYPASNVSGMLERPHFSESVAFAQQLIPAIESFGFIIKDSPTARAHLAQILREADSYSAKLAGFETPRTLADVVAMTRDLKDRCDVLFVAALAGVLDEDGNPLPEKEAVKIALENFGNKPTIGAEEYTVKYGALCTVARTGREQGEAAARMLLQAMRGTPVSQIPVETNHKGKRVINAATMRALGIEPRPEILRGAELVRTEQ